MKTAQIIHDFIINFHFAQIIKDLGGVGLAVQFKSENKGNHVALRAELDALPIEEINDFDHKSKTDGVSHKCGHDGHMTILAGVAEHFSKNKLKCGTLTLVFQPAEENGEGAKAILSDEKWNQIHPDYILALHNVPGFPLHSVICKEGFFTPSVKSIIIKLDGKTSHAAEPERGINPAMAVSKIISAAHDLESRAYNKQLKLITPIQINLGEEAYGISAGYADLKFNIRAWDDNVLDSLIDNFVEQIKIIAQSEKLKLKIDFTQFFSANVNDPILVEEIRKAALSNNLEIINLEFPFKWGEDFGLFTQKYSGALFGLGAGEETPALHNPDYDFPDELIDTGISMFVTLVNQLTAQQK